jgi:hypothetical protein
VFLAIEVGQITILLALGNRALIGLLRSRTMRAHVGIARLSPR